MADDITLDLDSVEIFDNSIFDIRHHVEWCAMPRFSLVSVTIEGVVVVSRGVPVRRVSPSVRHHEFSGRME